MFISTFFVLTKSFHRKPIFCVTCVKKTKFDPKNGFSWDFFLSFYARHKKCRFFKNLSCAHRMLTYTRQIFVQFFYMQTCIFNGSSVRVPKWISLLKSHLYHLRFLRLKCTHPSSLVTCGAIHSFFYANT